MASLEGCAMVKKSKYHAQIKYIKNRFHNDQKFRNKMNSYWTAAYKARYHSDEVFKNRQIELARARYAKEGALRAIKFLFCKAPY